MTRNMLKWLNLSDYTFKKSSKSHEETCKENPFPKKQNKTKKILKTDKKKKNTLPSEKEQLDQKGCNSRNN